MNIIPERIRSIYLCLYCSLILPPTAVLALLECWGLCDPNPAPWLRKAALLGAIPLIIVSYAVILFLERRLLRRTRRQKENPPPQ